MLKFKNVYDIGFSLGRYNKIVFLNIVRQLNKLNKKVLTSYYCVAPQTKIGRVWPTEDSNERLKKNTIFIIRIPGNTYIMKDDCLRKSVSA